MVDRQREAPMISRLLFSLLLAALAAFVTLALLGLWDRYVKETAELGFNGIYERYLASQANFPNDPNGYRAAVDVDRKRQLGNVGLETTALEE
jgi:hypothetical protein